MLDGGDTTYLTFTADTLTVNSKSVSDGLGVKNHKMKASGKFATKEINFNVTLKAPCTVSSLTPNKTVADMRY